jgi:hypothetical protein
MARLRSTLYSPTGAAAAAPATAAAATAAFEVSSVVGGGGQRDRRVAVDVENRHAIFQPGDADVLLGERGELLHHLERDDLLRSGPVLKVTDGCERKTRMNGRGAVYRGAWS